MFKEAFQAPQFRPGINVGCLMDISTGHFEQGIHGESILNGGALGITGVAARPNNFKTALLLYILTMMRRACHHTHSIVYDTESTLHPNRRLRKLAKNDPYLSTIDFEKDPYFAFTDLSRYTGDEFFDLYRKIMSAREKDQKNNVKTTPFVDKKGVERTAVYPASGMIDSLSKMIMSGTEETYDKNMIGAKEMNTEAMNNGRAKKQMFNQIPGICSRYGGYLFLSAHVSDVINIEAYPADKRNLSYMKKDTKLEGVSNGFYSLPNNLWMIFSNTPLLNKDKMPEYPLDNSTAMQGDTDLVIITMMNLRGKGGMSGLPIKLIISQSDGVLAALSEFHYVKEAKRFGLGGNLQNYHMTLCPDVTLSRTTVRKKLDEDPKLRKAVQFTAELLQLHQFHRGYEPGLLCTPEELYEDLKKMGYDWDQLLETRSYWVFKEEEAEHPLPFLSVMDLLNMRQGTYVPYWLDKDSQKKLDLLPKAA